MPNFYPPSLIGIDVPNFYVPNFYPPSLIGIDVPNFYVPNFYPPSLIGIDVPNFYVPNFYPPSLIGIDVPNFYVPNFYSHSLIGIDVPNFYVPNFYSHSLILQILPHELKQSPTLNTLSVLNFVVYYNSAYMNSCILNAHTNLSYFHTVLNSSTREDTQDDTTIHFKNEIIFLKTFLLT